MLGALIPESIRQLFSKAATNMYPAVPFPTPEGFRGKLIADNSICIGCKLCVRDCPAQAIEVVKTGEKQFKIVFYFDRCIYCGQCAESCNKNVIKITSDHELAAYDRASLKSE